MTSGVPSDNVFIGELPASLTQQECREIFGAYGQVTQCRVLPVRPSTGKASALVRFGSVIEATWITENLDGNLVEGLVEPITARFANPSGSNGASKSAAGVAVTPIAPVAAAAAAAKGPRSLGGRGVAGAAGSNAGPADARVLDNVFIGELPAGMTTEECKAIFGTYGQVVQCRVLPARAATGKSSALVRFGSVEEAKSIVESLNGSFVEGLAEPIQARFANNPVHGDGKGGTKGDAGANRSAPYPVVGEQGGPATFSSLYSSVKKAGLLGAFTEQAPDECQVFLSNLPPDTTDLDLFKLFSPFGAIGVTGVKALVNPDGTCKGIGFVDFVDPSHAELAIQTLHGHTAPDGTTLHVALKRSGKGKKGGR